MSRKSVEFGMFPSLAVAGLATYRSALNIESPTCNIINISLRVGCNETCYQINLKKNSNDLHSNM